MKQATDKNERWNLSEEQANAYIECRFNDSKRLRRLNHIEMGFARHVMDLAGPEASVLDAPCGSGRFFEIFKNARKLTMLDLSPSMLQVAKEKAGSRDGITILQGSVAELPLEDGQFDLVFCMRLLHHIGDDAMRQKMIGELARVSRKYVALSVYSIYSLRYLRRRILGKKPSGQSVSLDKFIMEAKSAGLTLMCKVPRISLIEQQRLLLFKK